MPMTTPVAMPPVPAVRAELVRLSCVPGLLRLLCRLRGCPCMSILGDGRHGDGQCAECRDNQSQSSHPHLLARDVSPMARILREEMRQRRELQEFHVDKQTFSWNLRARI